MSDIVQDAVCLLHRKSGEKDIEAVMFSPELGVFYVKLVSSLKGSKLSIPLFSVSTLYLAERNVKSKFILKDITVQKNHESIIEDYNKYAIFSLFAELLMFYGKYSPAEYYELLKEALELSESSSDVRLVFCHAMEKFFALQGTSGDYIACPICSREYEDEEVIGYFFEGHHLSCNECSSSRNILSARLRKYLKNTQDLSLEEAVNFPLELISVERLFRFECYRLRVLSSGRFKSLDLVMKNLDRS